MRRNLTLALLLLLAACAGAPPPHPAPAPAPASPVAATAPAPAAVPAPATGEDLDAPLPLDPAVVRGKLDNGLTYYLRRNERPQARADLRLLVNAGSILEDDDQLGLAHFVEHMAFNGTEHFARQELVDFLESIGMRFGPDVNAYTSYDETVYMLRLPTDRPELLDRGLEILRDWAGGVSFDDEEIDKERGVVLEEWRLGRGAMARLRDRQFPVLFQGSRYAVRQTIGEPEIIEHAPHDVLRRFYRDWYRPDLMSVVAVGDFDPAAMERDIRARFADLANPSDERPRPVYPVPAQEQTLVSIETDPEATQTQVGVYTKRPPRSQDRLVDYRRSLVERLYHSMFNDRLDEIARRPDPPFLYAGSDSGFLVRASEVFYQAAGAREGDLERALEALLVEAARVERHGFAAGELERAKKDMLRAYESANQERDQTESDQLADELGRAFLEGEPVPGIAAELDLVRRFLPTITLEEVDRLAHEALGGGGRVILASAPASAAGQLPTAEALLATFERVRQQPVEAWVDRVVEEPLVPTPPAPGRIVEERRDDELGTRWWRLSNGVQVVLKPTDFKNDEVVLSAFSPGGSSLVSDDDLPSALFATAIARESGLGAFDRDQLTKELAGKVAQVSPYIGELDEGFSGSASPADLETLLQLVYLQFTAPRFEPAAFDSFMTRLGSFVAHRLDQPEAVFSDRMAETLSQGSPRRPALTPELLSRVHLDAAERVYRDRFADASDFTFILVGSVDPETAAPLVATYLGGLSAGGRQESWRDQGITPPDRALRVEVRKGLEPKSRVSLVFTGPAEWSLANRYALRSLAEVLEIRLREVLREDLGATYGVSVDPDISPWPLPRYSVTISFGCAPEQAQPLVDRALAEIALLGREGAPAVDVDKVRETQLRQRETDLRENGFWGAALGLYLGYGEDPHEVLHLAERTATLTPQSVGEAARRYLDPARLVVGILYPEASAPAAAGD